jgi:hypothetical protein
MVDTAPQYGVHELTFEGPSFGPDDAPARTATLRTRWRHERGERRVVDGFWDGDGEGGAAGDAFRVRFCPTRPGRWTLVRTESSAPELAGQREGYALECESSDRHGFWVPDERTPGNRWYRRSDGTRQYVVGNTHYAFLSEQDVDGPRGGSIEADVRGNAEYFRKLRFAVTGDRYPHPEEKPFRDDAGKPTEDGDHSHRPDPGWFRRADRAVTTAHAEDLAADLILNGPDTRESRSVLRAAGNGSDPEPFLRYVAARYGSYPNVWFCLSNEWDIKTPRYRPSEIRRAGETLREYLPYPTPVSAHASPRPWPALLSGDWHDHAILQNKQQNLGEAADFVAESHVVAGGPVVNDELAYQGEGDGWTRADVVEAFVGAFCGGGYATTGYKPGDKVTQYFWGGFDPEEHTAARNLRWLRDRIEALPFGRLEPVSLAASPFAGYDPERRHDTFRTLAGVDGDCHVLGSNTGRAVRADLRDAWRVRRHDALAMETADRGAQSGPLALETPDSRAGLTVLRRA